MTARRTPIRTTFAVATVAVVAAALNGCAVTPEGTGTAGEEKAGVEKTNESMAVVSSSSGGSGIVVAPPKSILTVTYPISDYTYAPTPDGAACLSRTVAVPADLAGYGCSYGVEYVDIVGKASLGYAWACPSNVVIPSKDIGGFGLPEPYDFYPVYTESVHTSTTFETGCFGTPIPGYVLVVNTYFGGITGGCRNNCYE
ncbi:MAG TPA: hypothetical protein VGI39_15700 [Polyangiaceae bacterium]